MVTVKIQKPRRYAILIFVLVAGISIDAMAHEWMAPKEAADIKNSAAMDEGSKARGKEIYLQNCAACHGDNIEGLDAKEVGLEMGPPNLKKRIKTHSDGDFFWKIQEGRDDMPAFREDLSDSETWDIINYIRSEAE